MFKTVTKEMRDQLRAPLPSEAIKAHPTKTYLSAIKPIFVTERLNDVFGVGAWQLRTESVERYDKGVVVVKDIFTIPEYNIYYECFGGNDNGGEGSKNFDLGDAYKGATTDALTKIASYLEIGIDVFKGLKDAPKPKAKPETKAPAAKEPAKQPETPKELEELTPTHKSWGYVKTRLGAGVPLETIQKTFRISEENQKKLTDEKSA
jgi:hypothetical protein